MRSKIETELELLANQVEQLTAKIDMLLMREPVSMVAPSSVAPDSQLLAQGRELVRQMTAARRAGDKQRLRELRKIQPGDVRL